MENLSYKSRESEEAQRYRFNFLKGTRKAESEVLGLAMKHDDTGLCDGQSPS